MCWNDIPKKTQKKNSICSTQKSDQIKTTSILNVTCLRSNSQHSLVNPTCSFPLHWNVHVLCENLQRSSTLFTNPTSLQMFFKFYSLTKDTMFTSSISTKNLILISTILYCNSSCAFDFKSGITLYMAHISPIFGCIGIFMQNFQLA